MSASEDKMECSTELILEAVCERIRAMQFPHDVVVNIEKILANPEAYEPLLRKLAFAHPDYFESIVREILDVDKWTSGDGYPCICENTTAECDCTSDEEVFSESEDEDDESEDDAPWHTNAQGQDEDVEDDTGIHTDPGAATHPPSTPPRPGRTGGWARLGGPP